MKYPHIIQNAAEQPESAGSLHIGTDTAYHAGAPTIALEQPQTQAGSSRRELFRTAYN